MQARLVVIEPATEPAVHNINLPVTIGRGDEANLKLVHGLVSRQHCELFEDRGRIMVRDLGSRNGTFVGGQRVEIAPLPPGEVLTVGGISLRAVYGTDVVPAHDHAALDEKAAAEETVSIEDTAQASLKEDMEEPAEPLSFGEDDPNGSFDRW